MAGEKGNPGPLKSVVETKMLTRSKSYTLHTDLLENHWTGSIRRYIWIRNLHDFLPTGGKKPRAQRKASSKKATSAVKSILAAADEIPRTKRANLEPVASLSRAHQCSMLSVSTPQDQGNFQSALYGVMANTVNFSTPGLPPLLHFSPESAKGSSYSTRLPSSVQQSYDPSSVHSTASDSSVGQPLVVMFLNK